MMRQTICKKIQNNKSESVITRINSQNTSRQKLLLVKNYLEQKLETQGYRGHVKYDFSQELIQYRIKEGTIAVMQNGKLAVFEMPIKKFHGSMPLEFESVDIDSIKTEKATCCKRCHTWRLEANITRCHCGGYLVYRKRFSVQPVESWDESFLEVQFAKADIRAALKIEKILSQRPKRYHTTGITPKLAGISSTITQPTQSKELLLIPSGEHLRVIPTKSVDSCSLVFCSEMSIHGIAATDIEKLELLKKYNLNHTETDFTHDVSFASDVKAFSTDMAPLISEILVDSWNHPYMQSKVYKKIRSVERKQDNTKLHTPYNKKYSSKKRDATKYGNVTSFASSLPVPIEHQKVKVVQ